MLSATRMFWLKLAVSLGIVPLVYFHVVDLRKVASLWASPGSTLGAFCLLVASFLFGVRRWYWVLRSQGHDLKFSQLLSVAHLSQFVGLFLPGSVGVDLARFGALNAERVAIGKWELALSIFIDRLLGLVSLLLLLGAGLVLNWAALAGAPELKLGLLVCAVVMGVLVLWWGAAKWWTRVAALRLNWWRLLSLSLLNQLATQGAYVLLLNALLGPAFDWRPLMLVIPLGILSAHLPISWNGFVVTHLTHAGVYQLLGLAQGGDTFSSYFVLSTIFQLTGFYSWWHVRHSFDGVKQ